MTTIVVVLGVLLALAVGAYLGLRNRPPKEEPFLYFRCPRCEHKLRYLAVRAGHRAVCPRCRKQSVLPVQNQDAARGA
jgi:hypothetical protein